MYYHCSTIVARTTDAGLKFAFLNNFSLQIYNCLFLNDKGRFLFDLVVSHRKKKKYEFNYVVPL